MAELVQAVAADSQLDKSIGTISLCTEATSCIKDQGLLPFWGIDSAVKYDPDRLPALPPTTAIQASYDLQAVSFAAPFDPC